MDRRAFLVAAGRLTVGAVAAAAIDACADHGPATVSPSPSGGSAIGLSPSGPPVVATSPVPAPPRLVSAPAHDDAIARENLRRGSRGWDLGGVRGPVVAAGFVDRASAAPGESIALHLQSSAAVNVEWYRLGWYGGDGGRQMRVDPAVQAAPAPAPSIDPATGMAEAPDAPAIRLTVPDDWPSGQYVALMRPRRGAPSLAPFTVRPRPAPRPGGVVAPVLFVSAAATWQAYNAWGGADFYDASDTNRPAALHGSHAVQVSFDRPHLTHRGAGLMPRWELPFVRWQERHGRAVEYCADVDLELHPEIVKGRRLLVFAGHHEYWSRPMRSTLELAIASGVNVAFLSANEVYWQVRLEASPLGPGRRITCWKAAAADPLAATHPELATCRWRDAPVNDPEATVIGQMYGHVVERPADWVVAGSAHWLYEGTRLRDGDRLVNLVGQEYDAFDPTYAQPGTTLLARSPVTALARSGSHGPDRPTPGLHTATIYTAESGATVFAAGTFQWSWALDRAADRSYRGVVTPVDARVGRMTANLFDRLGDGPLGA